MQKLFKAAILIFLVNNLFAQPLRFYDRADSARFTAIDVTGDDKGGWLTLGTHVDSSFSIIQFDYCGKIITNQKYPLPANSKLNNPQIMYLGKEKSIVLGTLVSGTDSKILVFISVGGIISQAKILSTPNLTNCYNPVMSAFDENNILIAFNYDTNSLAKSSLVMLDKNLNTKWARAIEAESHIRWVKMLDINHYAIGDGNNVKKYDTLGTNSWSRSFPDRQMIFNSALSQDTQLVFLANFMDTSKLNYNQLVSLDHRNGRLIWRSELTRGLRTNYLLEYNSKLLLDNSKNYVYNAIDTMLGDSIPALYAHTYDAKGSLKSSKRWSAKDSVIDYKSSLLNDGNYGISLVLGNSTSIKGLANVKASMPYEGACGTTHDSNMIIKSLLMDTLVIKNIPITQILSPSLQIIGHDDNLKLNRVCEIFDLKDGEVPIQLCKGDSVFLPGVTLKNATYQWDNGSHQQGIYVKEAGNYSVKITYCEKTITITYKVTYTTYQDQVVALEECDYPLRLDANKGPGARYVWTNGDTTNFLLVPGPGTYSVNVTQCEMTYKVTFNVTLKKFTDQTFDIRNVCDYPFPLYAYQGTNIHGATYLWDDGSTKSAREVSGPGTYKVTVSYCLSMFVQTFNVTPPNFPDQNIKFEMCDFPQLLYAPQGDTIKGATYVWDDGSTGGARFISDTGTYKVTVTYCHTSFLVTFKIDYRHYYDQTFDFNICTYPDKLFAFYGPDYHGVTYKWDNGSTTEERPISGPGTYKVTVNYCHSTFVQTFNIAMRDYVELKFPNVFPPNSEILINKVFKPLPNDSMEITKYKLDVYNRWGKLVFESAEVYSGWDGNYQGEAAPMDTYMFIATMSTKCGDKKYKGTVTLVR